MRAPKFGFYEFFAGGGMARLGLGQDWRCLAANDIDPAKAATYCRRFGVKGNCPEYLRGSVADLRPSDLPDQADLAWASFPCQDLSLAGYGRGLAGERSGTFWPFWNLMRNLKSEGRAPRLVVLENVVGALTSHGGQDFAAIIDAIGAEGYRAGAMTLDAARFLPQSRPRLFIVAVSDSLAIPASLLRENPAVWASSSALLTAYKRLDEYQRNSWLWWNLAEPFEKPPRLSDLVDLTETLWDAPEKTKRILSMMSGVNRKKIKDAQREGKLRIGTVYRRTRPDIEGRKVQRAEVRFDDVAGCLRTPAGGSSRQTILVVDGPKIRTRLLTACEAARLMGVDPDTYPIPVNYNAAYHLFGDGLAVPVVSWLNKHLLLKLAQARSVQKAA